MVAKAMTNTILTLLSAELIERHYGAGHWRDDTIYSLVRDHARRAPEKFALRERFRRLGYGALIGAVDVLAADLAAHGVEPGERVAVWLPSRMESVIALLACSRNGYVCCPSLHRDHTSAEILELLRRTRAAAFIGQAGYGADADRRDIFAELAGIETLKHVYRLEPPGSSLASCPALGRASTSWGDGCEDVDGRDERGHDGDSLPGGSSRYACFNVSIPPSSAKISRRSASAP